MYYPRTDYSQPSRLFTDSFYGYNHNLKIADGEWYEMTNLSSREYPLLSERPRRGEVTTAWENFQGLAFKDALIYVDGPYVYMNGIKIEGPALSTSASMQPKQLISMGAYLLIWPDKVYINTADITDWGPIDQYNRFASGTTISYSLCKADGTAYTIDPGAASDTPPENPVNGQVWIDTSGETHVMKQWSTTTSMWVQIATVYVKISAAGIGIGISRWDGVTLSGLTLTSGDTGYSEALKAQIEALNGSHVVYDVGAGYIVVVGLIDKVTSHTTASASEASCVRAAPDMEYLTEANNRIWGCHYGLNAEGETVNEIYCCALGDFKNWQRYLGVSTDAWAGSVGTDGRWTGAATFNGDPIFFKENCLHRVYVSTAGAHRIVDTQCRGVARGASKSLKVVGERLYYLSTSGVMSYDGSLPVSVHTAFGNELYKNGVAGRLLDKYYISMQDSSDVWHMFVLDTARVLWHREDNTHVKAFAEAGDDLYYVDANDRLFTVMQSSGTQEDPVFWEAVSGLIGYEYADHKYVTRINIRAVLPKGSDIDLYIEYNSSGHWVHGGHFCGDGTHMIVFPIRPERCDHYRIKINGTGEIKLYSIAKNLEVGSDIR